MPNIKLPIEYISKLSKADQILELNSTVRCRIAPSQIEGVGVFTIRDIKKGDRLYCVPNFNPKFYTIPFGSLGKLFPEVRKLVLDRWASVVNGSVFQSPNDDARLILFMNHSSEKSNYDLFTDCATMDIACGEEVLGDYRIMENYKKVFPWIV